MDIGLWPRGRKRLLDDDYLSSSPWRSMSLEEEPEDYHTPLKGLTSQQGSSSEEIDQITVQDENKISEDMMMVTTSDDTEAKDAVVNDDAKEEPSRKKVRFSDRARQGSAPPRLELGINAIYPQNDNGKGVLSLRQGYHADFDHDLAANDQISDSIKQSDDGDITMSERDDQGESNAKERMEGLLDDLETEVTCGLCAGVFIDPVALNPCSHVFCGSCIVSWLQSYQLSTRMSYTNPFPALKDYMLRMREISDDRYDDGYESTSSNEGNSPPRSARARRHPDEGSDSEDDYYPVNPYLQRAREQESVSDTAGSGSTTAFSDATVRIGISKTPKNGLACPTCRTQPVVDATGSCLVTSMVGLVQKHRPDLVRSANETEQAQKAYKRGDKLSFPIPPAATASTRSDGYDAFGMPLGRRSTSGMRNTANTATPTVVGEVLAPIARSRSGRRAANDYWSPCYHCAPLRSPEAADRYVCEEPVAARTHRTDYGCPPGHSLCSICGELGPQALTQTCSGCGEGVCGMPTRGCKIPKLEDVERLAASTSFTQVERLMSASQILDYGWNGYGDAFQHNYYELAKFVLFCIKKNQSSSSATGTRDLAQMPIDSVQEVSEHESSQKVTMVNVIKATMHRLQEDGDQGSLRSIFERANKAWPWVSQNDPERLCKVCVNAMLEASIFEWWMRDSAKPEIASQLPARKEDCKYGRSCAFQEDLEHAKSFNHLCERLPENDFVASTQPTPTQDSAGGTTAPTGPDTLLRRAIIELGPAFDLSQLVMEDLRYEDAHYSGHGASTRTRTSTEIVGQMPRAGEGDVYADDESYNSEDEEGSREGTPASQIIREKGMESKAAQTEAMNEAVANVTGLGEDQVASIAGEPATAVGRSVVDLNGDLIQFDDAGQEMDQKTDGEDEYRDIGSRREIVVAASPETKGDTTPPINQHASDIVPESPIFGNFLLTSPSVENGYPLDQPSLASLPLISSPGVPLVESHSSQESVVEDLVASSFEPYEDGLPSPHAVVETSWARQLGMAIEPAGNAGMPAGIIARSNVLAEEQQHSHGSARSSPAPEAMFA